VSQALPAAVSGDGSATVSGEGSATVSGEVSAGGVSGAALPMDPIQEAERQWIAHGWTEAADGMAMVTAIMRVQQIMMQRVDTVLRPMGLTFARYEILMLLSFSRRGSLPMSRIGSRLQVHPTSVTSAIDRLQAQGYVTREPHPKDRRAILATLTEAGRSVAADATVSLNQVVFEQPGLNTDDVRQLNRTLRRVRAGSGDF
jgi:DNA-binding MarR family transcriptional regulator